MSVKELRAIRWPKDWRNVPLWAMFDRVKDVGHPDEEMLSVYREYGVIKKSSRDDNTNQTAENRNIYQLIDVGWLIVNRMKAWQGSVGISLLRGIVSGHYICFRPRHGEDPRFLNQLVRSAVYTLEYARMSRGVRPGQVEIDNDELHGLRIILPPLEEQRRIADFLDRETAWIDALIATKRRMIELLEERWRSVVEGTMSALIAERGAIPLRYLVTCLDGRRIPVSAEERASRQGDYPYYGASGVVDRIDGWLFDEELVLLGEDGAQLGDPTYPIAQVVRGKIWVNNHAHVLRPRAVDAEFLSLHLNTFDRIEFMSGGTREKITQDDMSRIPVPRLTIEEQRRVGRQLSRVRAHSDGMVTALATQINLLNERRQALITAAVTGQFDIPEVA